MLQTKEQEFAAIKGQFILEKNSHYQEVGNYMWPSQTVERNLHRSFLRFQVSEQGVMTLSSIYHGSRALHHSAVKVIAPDGTYAATPACKDVFRDHNLGEWMECADFHYGMDGGVIKLPLSESKISLSVSSFSVDPDTSPLSPPPIAVPLSTFTH
jgi:hypothetical protein